MIDIGDTDPSTQDSTEQPQSKGEAQSFEDSLISKENGKTEKKGYLLPILMVGLIILIIFASSLIFMEAILPKITQTVIDNSKLELDAVRIGELSENGFDLDIYSTLVRKMGISAYMHETELSVYVERSLGEANNSESVQTESGGGIVRQETVVGPNSDGLLLGTLEIPATKLTGKRSPLEIHQIFQYSSQETFDEFAVALVKSGSSSWHIVGTTSVTLLGKRVDNLKFDKTVVIQGPDFMQREAAGDSSISKGPEVVDMSIDASEVEETGVDVKIVLRILNNGATTLAPLGVAVFDLSYSGISLGELTSNEATIKPGYNDLQFTGLWNLTAELAKITSFLEMVRVLKIINEIKTKTENEEIVVLVARGVSCSNPLYNEAVKAIETPFPIEGLVLDLARTEDEEPEDIPISG